MRAKLAIAILLILFFPLIVPADVTVYGVDTSGSMVHHGFEDAKLVLIREVENARPGDVIFVASFDVSDRLLGRLAVGEDGSPQAKAELISKIRTLRATGKWTNLDVPVKARKALLLEERAPGTRRIVILSDGLSDPAPGFERVDLRSLAEMVPQSLGFSLYLIALPEDLAGLFQMRSEAGVVVNPVAPNVRGIPLAEFSRERMEEAFQMIKEEDPPPAPEPASHPVEPSRQAAGPSPLPISLGLAGVLLALAGGSLWIGRKGHQMVQDVILEVREEGQEIRRIPLPLRSRTKRTVGPKGDIPLAADGLPPVVCTLQCRRGRLWLIPQDSITVNARPVTARTAVGVGDHIGIRQIATIAIDELEEGGTQS